MLKKLLLTLALLFGAFTLAPSQSQATPLGASAQTDVGSASQVQQVRWYRYRYRPRRYYFRRYYRPRFYGYRRYYRPRYYRRRFFY